MMDVASGSRVASQGGSLGVVCERIPRRSRLDRKAVMSVRLAGGQNWLRFRQSVEDIRKGIIAQRFERMRGRVAREISDGKLPWEKKLGMTSLGFGLEVGAQVQRMRFENQRASRSLMAALSLGSPTQGEDGEAKLRSESEEVETKLRSAMSEEQVNKCLDGVPVYTVSNSASEFVVVSEVNSSESYGIICFREADAEAVLSQIRDREPSSSSGIKVLAVPLGKVLQLSSKEGETFRFIPDPNQVRNAYEVQARAGELVKAFDGVPVFQSESLTLSSNNRRFLPIFFSKEDLENALQTAFEEQQKVNPTLEVNSDIQVDSLEDILEMMEGSEAETGPGEIVFIPPGMDPFKYLTQTEGTLVG